MDREVERILHLGVETAASHVKTAIPFKAGDRVRVKEGYFQISRETWNRSTRPMAG